MSLAHPLLLLLLVIPVLMIAWVWMRRGREVALPYDFGLPKQGFILRGIINLAECLPALLLAIVIIILAGPQRLGEPRTIPRLDTRGEGQRSESGLLYGRRNRGVLREPLHGQHG